ncbi:MAG: hypothetical protein ACT4PT_12165 [Methanobacteriota archaeon]
MADLATLKAKAEASPANPMLRYLYGRALLDARSYELAAAEFRACVEAKADWSAAWRELGRALAGAGDAAGARAAYERGLTIGREKGDLQTVKEIEVWLGKLVKG